MSPPMGIGQGLGLSFVRRKSSPSAPFGPATVSGNVLFLVSYTGVANAAGKVTTWTDQSASPKNALAGTNPPTWAATGGLGGFALITVVGGAGTCLAGTAAIVAAGADRTIFIVQKASTPGTVGDLLCSTLNARTMVVRYDTAHNTTGDENTFGNTGTYTTDTNAHVIEVTYSVGVISPYWIDGTLIAPIGGAVATSDTGLPVGYFIAGIGTASAGTYQGQIAAVLVYSGVLSAPNRSIVRQALGSKYGITVAP